MTDRSRVLRTAADLDDEALDWFARCDHDPAVRHDPALQVWLAADPARRDAFARWEADWATLDALPADAVAQLRRQLAIDKAAANALRSAPGGRVRPASPGRRAWMQHVSRGMPAAATALGVLAVSGGGYLAWDHQAEQPLHAERFTTERGQQRDVQLPDGSLLRLDTATQIDVALYRTRREVRLSEGQAVFHVQADRARPFDVLAGAVRVTVVGTRFSVRYTAAMPGDAGVRVAVEEGRVRVAGRDPGLLAWLTRRDGPAIELGAGQQVAADAAGALAPIASVGAAGFAPWREGRVSFDDTPLAQALAEFERYGDTGLTVRDPAVAALRLTGTFDPRRLGNFLLVLPKALPVRLRADGGVTEIVAAR
jgi:transmembrane sensor